MSAFGGYARYYDLLYAGKDYAGEAAFARERLGPSARAVFEIGCGTGGHAIELARMGCTVTGVDRSPAMVELAEARRSRLDPLLGQRLAFIAADARSCRLGREFDAVLSLFHVMSYQTSDADVSSVIETAGAHLPPGGPFLFDFWFGPAVLAQRPQVRTRRLRSGSLEFERVAEPRLRESENCVDVRYTVRGPGIETVEETHSMRYFFVPELERALARAGFELASVSEMQTGAPLSEQTWSACALARRL